MHYLTLCIRNWSTDEKHRGITVLSRIGKCLRINDIGAKTPSFFTVQGKKVMTRWFDPLPGEYYGAHVLTENNWLPSYVAVKMF